ncbi:MAG: hypothetical protein JNL05_06320 [Flavobacteriales bacterium]|nr:hypothetical protein [Flavobacteriales bacterium]
MSERHAYRTSDTEGLPWRALAWLVTRYVRLRHPGMDPGLRYFVRQGHLGRLFQLRYWLRDRLLRRPYKEVIYDGEFSPELKFVLPFAYWHHLNGTLMRTVGCRHTRALYFFSPDHEERFNERHFNDFHFQLEIPNSHDHDLRYDLSKWAQVPLKAHYRNPHFVFDRPMVVIANRYNMEWGGPPVSYFGLDELRRLITALSPRYQVVYNRPSPAAIVNDESAVLDLGEKEALRREFPDLVLLEDLMTRPGAPAGDLNALQLMVYANCERFISIHGGTATLASYFGGVNIILSVKGHEHYFGEFKTIYPKLSDARIIACRTMEEVHHHVHRELTQA